MVYCCDTLNFKHYWENQTLVWPYQDSSATRSKGVKRVGSLVISQEDFDYYQGKFRRQCEASRHTGKIKIPDDIFKQYNERGASREKLFEMFINTGGDKDKGTKTFLL